MRKILIFALLSWISVPFIVLATDDSSSACDNNLPAPIVKASSDDQHIILSWSKIDHYDLAGYKVVISKNDSSPVYPSNGYLVWLVDRNVNSYTIDNSTAYKNGDFGYYLKGGEDYYFSVTAVYNCDAKVAGNVLKLAYPGGADNDDVDDDSQEYPIPQVSVASSEQGVLLSWNKITDSRFTGYKVVISKITKNPKYPDHGYARYITNPNTTSYLLDNSSNYINGDFGGYLKPGEDYYFSITALYGNVRIAGNAVKETYNGPAHIAEKLSEVDPLKKMEKNAQLLTAGDGLGDILAELKLLRNLITEQQNEIRYLKSLIADFREVAQDVKNALNNFITYGVDENTQKLGAGERAAVIYSFKSAFNKLPETEEEMADAIKIANGRWPNQINSAAENRAKNEFQKIYLREADMSNPHDNAAVTIMAYGLRQQAENRNLVSEGQGIKTFKYIYNKLPKTTEEWNILQAITYSGATR